MRTNLSGSVDGSHRGSSELEDGNSWMLPSRVCYCGKVAKIQTSWTSSHPGRRFYVCTQQWHARTPKKADLLTSQWFPRQWGTSPFHHRNKNKRGEQFGTPSGTSQYTYSDRILLRFMNIGNSSQNPHHAMEINQVALREGLKLEESDARHSAHGSTRSRRSRTGSRRMNQIQESVLR
ncbi:unnamed protein product [Prunus armeniaca]